MNVAENQIPSLLTEYKKMTVIGLSPDPQKPSHSIPLYLREHGWDIVGVYPKSHSENGFQIYSTLAEVPAEYRRFVDVFRASPQIPSVVEEVLALGGVEVLFLQLGIAHPAAEALAEKAGIRVVSNHCLAIEHRKLPATQKTMR